MLMPMEDPVPTPIDRGCWKRVPVHDSVPWYAYQLSRRFPRGEQAVLVRLDDLQLMMNGLGGFRKTLGQQDLDPAQRFDGGIRDGRFEPTDLRREDPDFESRVRIGRRVLFGRQFRRHQSAIVFVWSQHVIREPADHAPTIKSLLVHRRTSCLPPERGVFHLEEVGQPGATKAVERRLRAGQPLYNGWQSVAEVLGALTDEPLDLCPVYRAPGSGHPFEQ